MSGPSITTPRVSSGTVDPALVASTWVARRIDKPESLLITADGTGGSRTGRASKVVEVGTAASGQSSVTGLVGSRSVTFRRVRPSGTRSIHRLNLAHRDELARHPTRRLGHDRRASLARRTVGPDSACRSELDRGQSPGWHHSSLFCAAGDGTPQIAAFAFTALSLRQPHKQFSSASKLFPALSASTPAGGGGMLAEPLPKPLAESDCRRTEPQPNLPEPESGRGGPYWLDS